MHNNSPAVAYSTIDQAPLRTQLSDLVADHSIETTPGAAAKIPDFRDFLRPGRSVAVTFLPGSSFDGTVATARRLKQEGFRPVPHVCARAIADAADLEDKLRRLSEDAGAQDAVVLAGGLQHPVGAFDNSMQLLATGLFEKYGFRTLGLAGHPEGTPDISDLELERALNWKNNHARQSNIDFYLCTQFVFEADAVISWDRRIRRAGNRLPIHVGIPGLATLKTLIGHAKACGVGPSLRVLTRQAKNISKLMTTRAPDQLLIDLADYKFSDPQCGIRKVHVYPFGGMQRSASWFQAIEAGEVIIEPDRSGFEVLSSNA